MNTNKLCPMLAKTCLGKMCAYSVKVNPYADPHSSYWYCVKTISDMPYTQPQPIDQDDDKIINDVSINRWLIDFQSQHDITNTAQIDREFFDDLARALCDDIPFGYESSHRLAAWIFAYFNLHDKDTDACT